MTDFWVEDNGNATVIDWAFVTRTPRIVDAVSFGVGLAVSGLDPQFALDGSGPFRCYDDQDVNAVLAALGPVLELGHLAERRRDPHRPSHEVHRRPT